MIDGFKCITMVDVKTMIENDRLSWFNEVYMTGEMKANKSLCEYRSLKLILYENGRLRINGSIQKFFYHGTNYRDFSFSNLLEALLQLENELNIQLDKTIIQNLELSINLSLKQIKAHELIEGLMYYGTSKNAPIPFRQSLIKAANYKEVGMTSLYLKFYDKGKQYKLNYDLLRIEIKYTRNDTIARHLNAVTLYDLVSIDLSKSILKRFKKYINALYIFDITISSTEEKIIKYANPLFWKAKFSQHRNTKLYHHKRLKQLSVKYGVSIYQLLLSSVEDKLCSLNDII